MLTHLLAYFQNRKTCKHLIAQGAFTKFLLFLVGPNAENVS